MKDVAKEFGCSEALITRCCLGQQKYLKGYDEIKDYIFDKHCVKVSSLYVAQVKQKHGIIERDCYNNSKKDNPKQPQCPPEKVKLIEEALRHFKMIP